MHNRPEWRAVGRLKVMEMGNGVTQIYVHDPTSHRTAELQFDPDSPDAIFVRGMFTAEDLVEVGQYLRRRLHPVDCGHSTASFVALYHTGEGNCEACRTEER